MRKLFLLLFFVVLWSCGNKETINPDTGEVITDGFKERFINNFRDYSDVTYSIMYDNLPNGIFAEDFENVTKSAFSQWSGESFYLKDGTSFNFIYQENNPDSDIIVRFIDKQYFIDNSTELPNNFCETIKCLSPYDNNCATNDCNSKAIAGAELARSSRYPEFLWKQDELNTAYAGNLLLENYWQNILIFNHNDISWAINSGAGIPRDSYDLETVIAHEIGHRLGFGHATDSGALMYEKIEKGIPKSFDISDRIIINSVYPNSQGTFYFINQIELGTRIFSVNSFDTDENPIQEITSSSSELFLTFENGLFMPTEMNVLFDGQNFTEIINAERWNHKNRRFKIGFSNLTSFHRVSLEVYQNLGQTIAEQLITNPIKEVVISKKSGVMAFNQSTKNVVEFYLDGTINDNHGTIPLSSLPFDNGIFDPQTFSYHLYDPSQDKFYKYQLTRDELSSYSQENILLLKYIEADYFVGIRQSDNTFVKLEPSSGVITVLANLSGSINGSFGSAINEDEKIFIYHNGTDIISLDYISGAVISQSSISNPGIGLAYSQENRKYYCISGGEIVSIDIENGDKSPIPFGASVSGVTSDALFIHPSDNRYYYVSTDGLLKGVHLTENISPTIINVSGYRYIKPIY